MGSRKHGIHETIIDLDDLEHVKSHVGTWSLSYSRGNPYVRCSKSIGGKWKTIQLHRFILNNYEQNLVVDHINHNTLDNRKSNLRLISSGQNSQNRKGPHKNNKMGLRGVCWHKDREKYYACIYINKKQKFLGYFDDPLEAERVVVEARKKFMPFNVEGDV